MLRLVQHKKKVAMLIVDIHHIRVLRAANLFQGKGHCHVFSSRLNPRCLVAPFQGSYLMQKSGLDDGSRRRWLGPEYTTNGVAEEGVRKEAGT